MGGKSGGAPKAPNYNKIAKQQGEINKQASLETTIANRPDQFANGGSVTWQRNPQTGQWQQFNNLDAAGQANFNTSAFNTTRRLNEVANQGAFDPSQTPEYDPMMGEKSADALYKRTMDRAGPLQQEQRDALNTRLVQQGLQPGTQGYDRAMLAHDRAAGDVNMQAGLDATLAGGAESRAMLSAALGQQGQQYGQQTSNYMMPWNLANNAQALQQNHYRPQFAGFNGASSYQPADMVGAAQSKYEAQMGAHNSGQNMWGSLLNAGVSLAAPLLAPATGGASMALPYLVGGATLGGGK